ncbi:hypothetical protein [Coprothermobacter platensis]|uniref:hypothetical protein n=1 Tax=Coprothermobacter platensis TaxID=108819 RepID=UPI00036F0A9E|nr:hypothetical protein [Coprothermobacter platensis]
MDSEVLERLDILRNSDQIDANEYEQTLYILRYVEETYGVEVENEVGGMFAVHVAKALNRIHLGEAIDSTPDQVMESIKGLTEITNDMISLFQNITGLSEVPMGEINFAVLYINLLMEAKSEVEGR